MAGRNDPCPCGSGKKYKKCCWRKDQAARSVRREPEVGDEWALDLVPMPIYVREDPAANMAILLLTSDDLVLYDDVIRRVPGETEEHLRLFEKALRQAIVQTGHKPTIVSLLYPRLIEPLADRFRGERISFEHERALPSLDAIARRMVRQVGGGGHLPRVTTLATWAGWALPEEMVAELFRAFAAFHRAAPWTVVDEQQVLFASSRVGRAWCLAIEGTPEEGHALRAFRDRRDLWEDLGPSMILFELLAVQGTILTVAHRSPEGFGDAARHEIRRAGWELAEPDVHPTLYVQGTPGGSVQQAHARDLIDMLWSLPRFVARFAQELADGRPRREPLSWTDPQTGVALDCWNSMMPEGEMPAPRPEVLAPCLPEGPGARPEMALPEHAADERHEDDRYAVLEGFGAWLEGLRRAEQDAGPAIDPDIEQGIEQAIEEAVMWAESYVMDFLADEYRIPLCAQTERDLRSYLYDWFPHKVLEEEDLALRLPGALTLFFRYLETQGLRCPWAAEILADEETFAGRWRSCPGRNWWDEGVPVWRKQLADQLEDLLLSSTRGIQAEGEMLPMMGEQERELEHELARRWLLWRDEEIAAAIAEGGEGAADPARIRARCEERQRAWEQSPHEAYDGRTPAAVVQEEREASWAEVRSMGGL